jgi:transposase
VQAATDAQRQLHALVITAPESVGARFRGRTTTAMVATANQLRPGATGGPADVVAAVTVLHRLAARITFLQAEANTHRTAIRALVRFWSPDVLELPGVGPIVAATVLTAWSHPGRCRNEAAFAMLAGAAPSPASGRTIRYRLNRSGDRNSTAPCTPSPSPGYDSTPPPAPTPNAAEPKSRPTAKSNAASSATSPDSSTDTSNKAPHTHLTRRRSVAP